MKKPASRTLFEFLSTGKRWEIAFRRSDMNDATLSRFGVMVLALTQGQVSEATISEALALAPEAWGDFLVLALQRDDRFRYQTGVGQAPGEPGTILPDSPKVNSIIIQPRQTH